MSYLKNLRELASRLPNSSIFNARLNFMHHIDEALSKGELPKHQFIQFELTSEQIERYLQNNVDFDGDEFETVVTQLQEFDTKLGDFRSYLQNSYGYWATVTQPLMSTWSKLFPNEKYLELMAGNGYISKGFRDNGIKSICTDNLSWSKQSPTGNKKITDVEQIDALDAIDKYQTQVDAIVLAWSPDREEIDFEILEKIRKTELKFFLIGEKYGATNSKKFWDHAKIISDQRIDELNQVYPQYDLVHDKIFLIQ